MLNRRHIIGGAAALPIIAIATPAMAAGVNLDSAAFRALLDVADAQRDRFNSLPHDLELTDEAQHTHELGLMLAASRAADRAIPTNWQEYTRLIEHMTDQGLSSIDDDNAERLLEHARRLNAKGA